MSFAIVKWNKPSVHFFGDLKLMPGANECTKAQVEAMRAHFVCKAQIEDGTLEIIEKPKEEQGLGAFKNAEAVKLIQSTMDRDLLGAWLESEKRPQVAKAINDQLAKIAPDKPKEREESKSDEKEEHFK